jgi:hypothetical protein
MIAESAHSPLLTQKTLPILIRFSGENLHRNNPVQRSLGAPIDDAETTAPDFLSVIKAGRTQLRGDGIAHVALCVERVANHHRILAMGSA